MEYKHLIFEPRPRQPWQAVDVGFLIARRWFAQLSALWLISALPVFLLIMLTPLRETWYGLLLFWWLKPLYERPLLFFLSKAVFSQQLTVRNTLAKNWKKCFFQLLPDLLWRRLSFSRSMNLAVSLLERQKGRARSDRLHMLHLRDSTPAGWLTVIGYHLEIIFAISIFILFYIIVPVDFIQDFTVEKIFQNEELWVELSLIYNSVLAFCMMLIAPFYVAGGFLLYINRRIRLEAWDLQLVFSSMPRSKESLA